MKLKAFLFFIHSFIFDNLKLSVITPKTIYGPHESAHKFYLKKLFYNNEYMYWLDQQPSSDWQFYVRWHRLWIIPPVPGEFNASTFNIVSVMIDETLRLVVVSGKTESLRADVYFQMKFVQLFI